MRRLVGEIIRRNSFWVVLTLSLPALLFADPPTTEELNDAVKAKISKVEEFKFLRDEAKKLGVKAYLFGGAAAAFGHYVRWDLARESGDRRYVAERFDYDINNILRSTQDRDIVVDGPPEAAAELQRRLHERFPQMLGRKSVWEVRLLRGQVGDKETLLNNPDFLNQHTDSNSTGLIEVTESAPGERAIRDLRAWDEKNPKFLEDLRLGKLHFYFSEKHGETSRAQQGLNPPIMSVIRYLTKAFQYGLEIQPEDREKIQRIIRDFSGNIDPEQRYVRSWIEKNAKKLFTSAQDVEFAWKTLEDLGLREKLAKLGNKDEVGTLAWWMNKEPLRAKPLGSTGRTAREIGLTEIAHDAREYVVYEALTFSPKGEPNVFISRPDTAGERATRGPGFYAMKGSEGLYGLRGRTGFTVRFEVNPDAREGHDFKIDGDIVVILNRNAVRVKPESFEVGPLEYLQKIATFRPGDAARKAKMRQKAEARAPMILAHERSEMKRIIEEFLIQPLPEDMAEEMIDLYLKTRPQFSDFKSFMEKAKKGGNPFAVLRAGLANAKSPETFIKILGYYPMDYNIAGLSPLVASQLHHFAALGPTEGEWEQLRKAAVFYDQGRFDFDKRRVLELPKVRTATDYVNLVMNRGTLSPKEHQSAATDFVEGSLEYFFSLKPTPEQILAIQRFAVKNRLTHQRLFRFAADHQIKTAKDFMVLATASSDDMQKSVEHASAREEFLDYMRHERMFRLGITPKDVETLQRVVSPRGSPKNLVNYAMVYYLLRSNGTPPFHDVPDEWKEKLFSIDTTYQFIKNASEFGIEQTQYDAARELLRANLDKLPSTAETEKKYLEFAKKVFSNAFDAPKISKRTLIFVKDFLKHPELVDLILAQPHPNTGVEDFIRYGLKRFADHPKVSQWIENLLARGDPNISRLIIKYVYADEIPKEMAPHFSRVLKQSDKEGFHLMMSSWINGKPKWKYNPHVLAELVTFPEIDGYRRQLETLQLRDSGYLGMDAIFNSLDIKNLSHRKIYLQNIIAKRWGDSNLSEPCNPGFAAIAKRGQP